MHRQRVRQLQRRSITTKLTRPEFKAHVRALSEGDVQELSFHRPEGVVRHADFTVGEVVLDLFLAFPVVTLAPAVPDQNHLVAGHDLLVTETSPPRPAGRGKLGRPEQLLNPSVQVMDAVWMHPYRRQDLELL